MCFRVFECLTALHHGVDHIKNGIFQHHKASSIRFTKPTIRHLCHILLFLYPYITPFPLHFFIYTPLFTQRNRRSASRSAYLFVSLSLCRIPDLTMNQTVSPDCFIYVATSHTLISLITVTSDHRSATSITFILFFRSSSANTPCPGIVLPEKDPS